MNNTTPTLRGRTALVTGASRGIGRAIALILAEHGARLALVARGAEGLQATAQAVADLGGEAHVIAADLREPAAADAIKADAERVLGTVHILVNGSGIFGPIQTIAESDAARWEETLTVNLFAPYRLCRVFAGPMLAAGWGRMINVSSAAALHNPGQHTSAYATSKAALNHMTRFLANEVAGRGVTANVIHPGDVKTEMWADIRDQTAQLPDGTHGIRGYRDWVRNVGEGGGDPPEAAARLVLWLCSDDAAVVNGQFVWIKGGMQPPFAAWGGELVVSAL